MPDDASCTLPLYLDPPPEDFQISFSFRSYESIKGGLFLFFESQKWIENSSLRHHSFQRRMKLENRQGEDQGKLQIAPLGIHMLLFMRPTGGSAGCLPYSTPSIDALTVLLPLRFLVVLILTFFLPPFPPSSFISVFLLPLLFGFFYFFFFQIFLLHPLRFFFFFSILSFVVVIRLRFVILAQFPIRNDD